MLLAHTFKSIYWPMDTSKLPWQWWWRCNTTHRRGRIFLMHWHAMAFLLLRDYFCETYWILRLPWSFVLRKSDLIHDMHYHFFYYHWFTCCTTMCLPVALPCVYPLHYHLFTFCTTICLPFALSSVYILYYFLFMFCTTMLLFVYLLYYCAKNYCSVWCLLNYLLCKNVLCFHL